MVCQGNPAQLYRVGVSSRVNFDLVLEHPRTPHLLQFAVAVSWHSETISDESSNEHLLLLMCCQVQLFIRLDSLCRPDGRTAGCQGSGS